MNQVDSQRRYGKGRKVPKTNMKRLKIIQGPLIHIQVIYQHIHLRVRAEKEDIYGLDQED